MNDLILTLSTGAVSFFVGAISTLIFISFMKPASYDDGWHDGYSAGHHDTLDTPAIWRAAETPRRHHGDTHEPRAQLPELDIAAEAALAGWQEELNATGHLTIPFTDLEASYPVPLAPKSALIHWVRASFPGVLLTVSPESITLTGARVLVSSVPCESHLPS